MRSAPNPVSDPMRSADSGAPPGAPPVPEPMDPARLAELETVMPRARIAHHLAALRAEISALLVPPAPPPLDREAWAALGRQAHAAAGHAKLLGYPGLGAALNRLEKAARAADAEAAAAPMQVLRALIDQGAPLPPEPAR